MTYLIERVLRFYNVEVNYHNVDEIEIKATNRFGNTFVMWLCRTNKVVFPSGISLNGNYWQGNSDFDLPIKVKFKNNIEVFALKLIDEVRQYDERFYQFKSYITYDKKGIERPLTWDESKIKKDDDSIEPKFKGSLTINRTA